MRVKLDEGAYAPEKAHPEDAGYDLRAREDARIAPYGGRYVFHTGVHVEIPRGWCGQIWSKSGLHVINHIVTTGLIDSGYSGEIVVMLTNHHFNAYNVRCGDKIAQLVLTPCGDEEIQIVDQISGGARGDGGFGSTGR